MDNSNKKYSFLRSYIHGEVAFGFWGFVSKGLVGVNALLIISQLDVYRYGLYVLIFAFYSLVTSVTLRPMSQVIFNDIARFNTEGRVDKAKKLFLENFFIRMSIAVFLFLGVFFGADVIARFYGEDVAILFRILSFVFVADAFYTSVRILFQVHLRFTFLIFRDVLYRCIKLLFLLGFLFFAQLNITEAMLAHVVALFIVVFMFIPLYAKLYRSWNMVSPAKESVFLSVVKTHGKWSVFSTMVSSVTTNIRPWLVQLFINTEAVAIFSIAQSLFGGIKTFIPNSTLSALFPREMSDKSRRSYILLRGTKYLVLFSLILATAGFFVAPLVIKLVLPQYLASIPLFLILLPALPLVNFQSMASKFLVALRKQRAMFFISIVKIIIRIVLPVAFLYFFGLVGMALERVVSTIIIGVVMYGYMLRCNVLDVSWKTMFTFDEEDKKFMTRAFVIMRTHIREIFAKYLTRSL